MDKERREKLNAAGADIILMALLVDMSRADLDAVLNRHLINADPNANNTEIANALITGNHCRKNGTSILTPLTGDK